jgi:hypothetical protein
MNSKEKLKEKFRFGWEGRGISLASILRIAYGRHQMEEIPDIAIVEIKQNVH